jgi:hypothetical protein
LPILQGLENHGQFYQVWNTNDRVTPDLAEELACLLEAEGVRDFVGAEVQRYTDSAMQLLPQIFDPRNDISVIVNQLIQQLMNRDH